MDLAAAHELATWTELALAGVTVLALLWVRAPYGRHARPGWGPVIPARVGWVVMEAPAFFGFLGWYLSGAQATEPAAMLCAALFLAHYLHRSFIFPFRIAADGKTMPAMVAGLAVLFNLLNGFVQGAAVGGQIGWQPGELGSPRLVVGVVLFLVGMGINLWADTALIKLRATGDGYQIPRGGLYEWISCPNYFGEILEWCGWALATGSLAGVAFAVYTAANIGPRAIDHHRWYRERFPDYPPERRALIPWVL